MRSKLVNAKDTAERWKIEIGFGFNSNINCTWQNFSDTGSENNPKETRDESSISDDKAILPKSMAIIKGKNNGCNKKPRVEFTYLINCFMLQIT